jgi:hypothetical protein
MAWQVGYGLFRASAPAMPVDDDHELPKRWWPVAAVRHQKPTTVGIHVVVARADLPLNSPAIEQLFRGGEAGRLAQMKGLSYRS